MQTVDSLVHSMATAVRAGSYAPGDPLPSVRALAAARHCSAGTAARAYLRLRAAGVATGRQRAQLTVAADGPARARAMLRGGPALRLTGSDDPAFDLLIGALGDRVCLVPGPRGSVAGMGMLARGAADAAAMHLWHTGTGQHNDRFARALTGAGPLTLLHLWRRQQVLVLPPGNPDGIRCTADLTGRRLAWRDPGTGSRLLLERVLHEAGVSISPDHGVTVDSHLAVAVAVVSGAAEAGLAVRATAESVGADWLPVAEEPFELVVRTESLPVVEDLLAVLASPAFRSRVEVMPGYDLSDSGSMRDAA